MCSPTKKTKESLVTEKMTRMAVASLFAFGASAHASSSLILNEYNCVTEVQTLENDTPNDGGDSFFGFQRTGNGGNWVEFVVTPLVTGNGTVSFGLSSAVTDSVIYSSKEGTNPPQLVVTSTP